MQEGLVCKSTGSQYRIRLSNGSMVTARLAGKIRMDGRKSTNPVVVGDWVWVNDTVEDGEWTIDKIGDRRNYIIRKSINLSKQTQIIAANIDIAFLVVTPAFPKTSTGFIDRFLVTCEAYGITPVLVFNKVDLFEGEADQILQEMIDIYAQIGYDCLRVSAISNLGLDPLKEKMKGKVCLFSGHSGVGKSSLINALEPGLDLKTGQISDAHLKGMHTTTFSELHELSWGAYIIDTPGIKELGLVEMRKEEIGHFFPEISRLHSECKFNNCLHINEPKCAVLKAVEEGVINQERYYNYQRILNGEEMDWNEWE